jgi:ribulose-phosphate 3-epimerase
MQSILVAPSMLSADFGQLNKAVETLNNSSADWFHLDVMDGNFVPNISFGFPIIKAIKAKARKPMDVHLMIEKPDRYIKGFKAAGADILTVQFEACTHLHRTLQNIKQEGMQAGVALNPHSPVNWLENIIGEIDLLLIMSVNPGFGGQSFIEESISKTQAARKLITEKNALTKISVDGGVDNSNAAKLIKAGADVLVSGSYIFKAENFEQAVLSLKQPQ